MKNPIPSANGVFPNQMLRSFVSNHVIQSVNPPSEAQFQPNSLDLRLGARVTRLSCSFLPGKAGMDQRSQMLSYYSTEVGDSGVLLERGQIYLFELQESLNLPADIAGFANPKSTTGRLDVFARLITDNGIAYDKIPAGYAGRLFLEVVPRSFPLIVRPGDRLVQLRLFQGNPFLSDSQTVDLLNSGQLIFNSDGSTLKSNSIAVDDGLLLSPKFTSPDGSAMGYQAKRNAPPIDFRQNYSIADYWDEIPSVENEIFVLEPDQFYIFASRERIAISNDYCAEMVPFDPTAGEVRTHYAGFFDSGFGMGAREGIPGAAAVLEVRSRDVFFAVTDGQPLFRLKMLRNIEPTEQVYGANSGASYQYQNLRLARHFHK